MSDKSIEVKCAKCSEVIVITPTNGAAVHFKQCHSPANDVKKRSTNIDNSRSVKTRK
jgi:hypothetical protein